MKIELDVHGFSTDEVVKTIQKTIQTNPKCSCIEVIHGFNSGNAIKNLLKNKQNIHNKRVLKTLPVPFNDGRTLIMLKELNNL